MNYAGLLLGAAEFGVMLPGVVLCLMPVSRWLRMPARQLHPIAFTAFVLISFGGGLWELNGLENNNAVLFALLVLCVPLYMYVVKLDKIKLLCIVLNAIAILSFGGLANYVVESAFLHDAHDAGQISTWGLAAQWVYSLIAIVVFYLFYEKKLLWLLANFHSRKIWGIACVIPSMTAFCNWMMIPRDYSTMFVGRIMSITWVLWSTHLIMFAFFMALFYYIARFTIDKYEFEKKIHLAQMQHAQYEAMQVYFMKTSQLRHDFRHAVRTLSELVENAEYAELERYIKEYTDGALAGHAQQIYCRHSAANALLQYYGAMAEESSIRTHFFVNLPAELPVSDVDISVILGNLIENAISASVELPVAERSISLSVDIEPPGELYIVMVNHFDGNCRRQGAGFLSTKSGGSGIGLSSVTAIADKYFGTAQFYAERKLFHSNVMLKLR